MCAVSTDELREALHAFLHQDDVSIIDLSPESLEHVFQNISAVADDLDVHDSGEKLLRRMKTSMEAIQSIAKDSSSKPRIAHIEWIEPIMVAGQWMLPLIAMAGSINLFPDENKRWIGFEELLQQDPDKILIAPCGFSIQRSLKNMPFLEKNHAWKSLRAVRSHEVYICEGSDYFNRPGPRLVDSLEILAEIYHPNLFRAKHFTSGWIRFGGD